MNDDLIIITSAKTSKYTYGKIIWTDIKNKGKEFEGMLDNKTRLPSGKGQIKCYEYLYEGFFEEGKKCGYGEIKYNHKTLNNNIVEIYYKGEFKNDLYNGKGYLEYNNNDIFEGDFINGKRSKGILKTKDFIYEGTFLFDTINNNIPPDLKCRGISGCGRMETNDYIYNGDYKNGLKEGNGHIQYKNIDNCGNIINQKEYRGKFKEDLYHGYGELKYNNKDIFEGYFEENRRNKGKLETADFSFKGDFYKNAVDNNIDINLKFRGISGKGKINEKFGNKYEAELLNGEIHNGNGKNENGFSGNFKDGKLEGLFIYEDIMKASGIIFHFMDYKDGKIDGESWGYLRDDNKIAKFYIKWDNNCKTGYTIEYISKENFDNYYEKRNFTVDNYLIYDKISVNKPINIIDVRYNYQNSKKNIIIRKYFKNDKFEITINIAVNMTDNKICYSYMVIDNNGYIIKKTYFKENVDINFDNLGYNVSDANLNIDLLLFSCKKCKYSCYCKELDLSLKKNKIKFNKDFYEVIYPDNKSCKIFIEDFQNLDFRGFTNVIYDKGKEIFNSLFESVRKNIGPNKDYQIVG
jgi:hypothetical protein